MVPRGFTPSRFGRLPLSSDCEHIRDLILFSNISFERRGIKLNSGEFSWLRVNAYALKRLRKDLKRSENRHTFLKTHFSVKMFRKKFSFIWVIQNFWLWVIRLRKMQKPLKTGMGTILKTRFSKNRNFDQNHILCENFMLIWLYRGVLRLRKVFS